MSIAAARPAVSPADPLPHLQNASPAEPGTDPVAWAHQMLLAAMARITDCQRREAEVRAHRSLRAATCWDDDRRLAAEQAARSLRRSPSLTVARLARTLHGCDWLVARWRQLRDLADTPTGWAPDHISLAHQLLGHDRPLISPDLLPWRDDGSPAALADRMLAELTERREMLEEMDETERTLAENGIEIESDKVLAALRREEAAAWKVLNWAQAAIKAAATDAGRLTETCHAPQLKADRAPQSAAATKPSGPDRPSVVDERQARFGDCASAGAAQTAPGAEVDRPAMRRTG